MSEQASSARVRSWRWDKWLLQAVVLGLVLYGIWKTMSRSIGDLEKSGLTLRDLDARWLLVAGVSYLTGLLPCGFFWFRVLTAMGQRPSRWDAVRAFFISQPGKYVPGKFMVVVLRTAMIRGHHVDTTLAAASIFVETLTMMSIGAAVGAALLALSFAGEPGLMIFAVCAAVGVGLPTLPPVLRQAAKFTRLHRLHPEIDNSLAGLTVRGLAPGWLGVACGWCLMGFSLWSVLRAFPPDATSGGGGVAALPLLVACASLSTVAGFVSGLPGGLGAREWVVMALVTPHFGGPAAVLSAVIHRGVMVTAELAASGVLLLVRRPPRM